MPTPPPYRHAEAYKLMKYRCEVCFVTEIIWNSRDGVTPFVVGCRMCRLGARHVEFNRDVLAPEFVPKPGTRYFRDGLREEARAILRGRLEMFRGSEYELPEEEWPAFIDKALEGSTLQTASGIEYSTGEFQPGWPMLVTTGTDQDSLPIRPVVDRRPPDDGVIPPHVGWADPDRSR